jgi:hypothetical protein
MNSFRTAHPWFFLLAMFVGLVAVDGARAEAKIVIQPRFETFGQYDSNFFRSDGSDRSVYTYHAKPGFVFGVETPKSDLLVTYDMDAQWYQDRHDVPAGQEDADAYDFVGHQAEVNAASQVTSHLLVGIDDLFIKTRDPANSDIYSNIVERYRYSLNRLSPRVVWKFTDRAGVGLKYTNMMTDYNKSIVEDSDEDRGTVDLFYLPSKRNTLGVNYQTWTRNYDQYTPDYTSHQVMLTVMRSGKYFSLTAGAGLHDRHFHERTLRDGSAVDDIDAFVWTLALTGQQALPEKTVRPKRSMRLSAGQNFNDTGLGHEYFKATRLDAEATCLIMPKLDLLMSGAYQESDFKTSSRNDDIYWATLGVDYLLNRYVTFGAESGYEARDSNETGNDYRNTYALLTISCQYDLASR